MPYVRGQERESAILIERTWETAAESHPVYLWWCPGCASFDPQRNGAGTHVFHIPPWSFDNDDMEHPTFSASYLSYGWKPTEEAVLRGFRGAPQCHSFVRLGRIEYLSDSEHELAGQTIDMVPIPDWLRRRD